MTPPRRPARSLPRPLSRGLWSLLPVLLTCFGAACARLAPSPAGPALRVDETLVDFGIVAAGVPLIARFPIRNRSRGRIVLNEVNCNCGSRSPRTFIVPGRAESVLAVELHPKGLGPIEQVVEFTTSDPQAPRLRLTARAHVGSP